MAFGFIATTKKTIISSSVDIVNNGRRIRRGTRTRMVSSVVLKGMGRRGLLSTILLVSATATTPPLEPESKKALLQKYLKKSEENKAKNDKKRLDDYYKRNYKDYFEFIEGSLKGKKDELSESERGILDWLQSNK